MLPALQTLLNPLGVDEFREAYWRKRYYVARSRRGLLRALARELEDFDVEALLRGRTEMVQAWFGTSRGGFRAEEMSPTEGYGAYEAGATLYCRVEHTTALHAWQRRLARELGHCREGLTCSVFAARRGAGTTCHYDALENFTIQLRGRKTWRLSPSDRVAAPLENWVVGHALTPEMRRYCRRPMPRRMPGRVRRVELVPGDMLYVPRGYWHSTEASSDSVSLFLGFPATPSVDLVLGALRARLIAGVAWRESFIDGSAGGAWNRRARAQVDALVTELKADVARFSTKDVLTWLGW